MPNIPRALLDPNTFQLFPLLLPFFLIMVLCSEQSCWSWVLFPDLALHLPFPEAHLWGCAAHSPLAKGTAVTRLIDPPILGPYHSMLALVFLSTGICCRLPWDSSPTLFSGPSGCGRMLSRVEETNESTLHSQLGPTELEHGHPEHTGGSSAAGVPEQGFGAEHLVRDMSHGPQLSPAWLNILALLRTFAQELHPGPALEKPMVTLCHPL